MTLLHHLYVIHWHLLIQTNSLSSFSFFFFSPPPLSSFSPKGLSEEEVHKRLKEHGHNAITPPPTIPEWKKFVKEFTGVFSIMLELAGLGCFANYALQGAAENVSS